MEYNFFIFKILDPYLIISSFDAGLLSETLKICHFIFFWKKILSIAEAISSTLILEKY